MAEKSGGNDVIYLDNAATTFPKPPSVSKAVATAINIYGANPGRSGHRLSMRSAKEIYDCRVNTAALFNAENEENVVFTLNCTHALNIVIKGLLKEGDHVVISNLEHNSVVRPLKEMEKYGVTFTQAKVFEADSDKTLNSFREAINKDTKLVICTHASNVWGLKLPIARIGALCRMYGIYFMVDAAQTAGSENIDIKDCCIDFLCTAGHKGLYGPMGTGILITDKAQELRTFTQGGTGTSSGSMEHPEIMPDKFESGTANLPGIAGLNAGIRFVLKTKPENIYNRELFLIDRLYDNLSNISGVILYTKRPHKHFHAPLLSFNIDGVDSEEAAGALNKSFDIAVRAGLHCSPLAHYAFNTTDCGAIRVSPSYFTTTKDIEIFSMAVRKIINGNKKVKKQ